MALGPAAKYQERYDAKTVIAEGTTKLIQFVSNSNVLLIGSGKSSGSFLFLVRTAQNGGIGMAEVYKGTSITWATVQGNQITITNSTNADTEVYAIVLAGSVSFPS